MYKIKEYQAKKNIKGYVKRAIIDLENWSFTYFIYKKKEIKKTKKARGEITKKAYNMINSIYKNKNVIKINNSYFIK